MLCLVVKMVYFIKILKTVYFLTVVALIITLPRILILIRIPMLMRCWKMIVCDLTQTVRTSLWMSVQHVGVIVVFEICIADLILIMIHTDNNKRKYT